MSLISLILIALGLAMDAFAASISLGFSIKKITKKHIFLIALIFGGFQAVMPLIGWIGGYMIRDFVVSIDHWIAFLLLGFLGAKMIYEGFSDDEDEKTETDWKHIFIMGVATSIDALAIGVSFALLPVNIFSAAGLIGGITFALCAIGVEIGRRFGHIFEKKAEIAGGIILIGIGTKILIEHLYF